MTCWIKYSYCFKFNDVEIMRLLQECKDKYGNAKLLDCAYDKKGFDIDDCVTICRPMTEDDKKRDGVVHVSPDYIYYYDTHDEDEQN